MAARPSPRPPVLTFFAVTAPPGPVGGLCVERTLREVESLPDHAFAGDDWLDRRGFLDVELAWAAVIPQAPRHV